MDELIQKIRDATAKAETAKENASATHQAAEEAYKAQQAALDEVTRLWWELRRRIEKPADTPRRFREFT